MLAKIAQYEIQHYEGVLHVKSNDTRLISPILLFFWACGHLFTYEISD